MANQHRLLTDLAAIEHHLTQMLSGMSLFSPAERSNLTWSPAVDIYETASGFVLAAELPGVQSSGIDIKVINDTLILRGERRWDRDTSGENFHRLESAYGQFERSFILSESIDADNIQAEFDHGVLKVILPKRSLSQAGREIEIKAS